LLCSNEYNKLKKYFKKKKILFLICKRDFKLRKERYFSLCVILSIILSPILCNNKLLFRKNDLNYAVPAGDMDDPVPNPAVNVGNLQDGAYTYTGADIVVYDYGIHIDSYVTVVVIDDGLLKNEWKALEQNPEANVNIIGFVTNFTYGGENCTEYITNPNDSLLEYQEEHGHGYAVISALAAVARDVKVIFIDLKIKNDIYGFEYGDYKIWDWIDNNQASKDIDIISWSWVMRENFTENTSIHQKWASLLDKNVIMLTAAGNYYTYLNARWGHEYKYQSYYSEWYSVGSINHETKGNYEYKDYKSAFSAWYEASTEGNHIVNWLEPGNGIPILNDSYYDTQEQCWRGEWIYGVGTSFSIPYLAAIVALIITGYHAGLTSSTDPSLQKVIEILLYASSRDTFDQQMRYGYVDAYSAYGKAYYEGVLAR